MQITTTSIASDWGQNLRAILSLWECTHKHTHTHSLMHSHWHALWEMCLKGLTSSARWALRISFLYAPTKVLMKSTAYFTVSRRSEVSNTQTIWMILDKVVPESLSADTRDKWVFLFFFNNKNHSTSAMTPLWKARRRSRKRRNRDRQR